MLPAEMRVKSGNLGGVYRLGTPRSYAGPLWAETSASVIIPFGSLDYLPQLSKCLQSVRWQKFIKPRDVEIVLVYLHRVKEYERLEEVKWFNQLIDRFTVRFVDVQKSYDRFPLCLGRNIGARAATNGTLIFIDADAVLDPEFIARSLVKRTMLVTCWFSYLKEGHAEISEKEDVRRLAPEGKVMMAAYGGGIVAPRSAVFAIRGFDEVYDGAWGADDNDMVDRLVKYGLDWYNLTLHENIVNLHQYHPTNVDVNDPGVIANRKRYDRLQTVIRNTESWGDA